MTVAPDLKGLAGRRILLVEDDPLISMLAEDLLRDAGCEVVGPAATLAEAQALAAKPDLDGAVLDINLGGQMVFPAADVLAQAGIPFVFVTGYAGLGLPDAYADRICIMKPYDPQTFANTVANALAMPVPGQT